MRGCRLPSQRAVCLFLVLDSSGTNNGSDIIFKIIIDFSNYYIYIVLQDREKSKKYKINSVPVRQLYQAYSRIHLDGTGFLKGSGMNHFEIAATLLTAIIMESLPEYTDYMAVKAEVMSKLRVDAQEIRDSYKRDK